MGWKLDIEAPVNGHIKKAVVTVLDEDGNVRTTDKADLVSSAEREKLVKRLAKRLHENPETIGTSLEETWAQQLTSRRHHEAQRDSSVASARDRVTVEILDASPNAIRRPLCLIGGRAFASTWLHVQTTVTEGVNPETGAWEMYDPPQVKAVPVLTVIRDDGQVFADGTLPMASAKPVSQLGLDVALPYQPPPGQIWSGAGVKRFLAGERPNPVEVFRRVTQVVDRFMDFERSLAPQGSMCELLACYVLATYLLDAFNVVGYLWPNGDKGAGKTNLLIIVIETAYLGQLILAGGSYASLRDLADYGATLAFDDAENVMDVRNCDPDKRALLLAGNRRGGTVPVKELVADRWATRHVNTFCPRLFSAIRLPDDVLASRTVTVPLVRSQDAARANADPLDYSLWPCDRRRLVDDLWSTGLVGLRELPAHDADAAALATLSGRDLQPWRAILAVAHWLQEAHGAAGLFDRMRTLAQNYQLERSDLEVSDPVRLAIKALRRLVAVRGADGMEFAFESTELASAMNVIAAAEDLSNEGVPFTNSRRVGWLLKRLRFTKVPRGKGGRQWSCSGGFLAGLGRAYGMTAELQDAEDLAAL